MKTFKQTTLPQKTALAVLTQQHAKNNTALAVLTFSVGAIDHANSDRVQLLPDGEFSAKDGRPFDVPNGKWKLDAQAFANLKTAASHRTNDFHFDYEHQTMLSEDNGKPAPAAGWFNNLEYIPGQGLFAAKVDWTPKAQQHINDKEYRYTSAVFSYDPTTGRPLTLEHVALTNDPALDGMKALAALKNANKNFTSGKSATNSTGEIPMTEALKLYLELLGVSIDGVDFTNEAALKRVQDEGKTALVALKAKADKAGTLQGELDTERNTVVALKAKGDKADPAKFVPVETYNALAVEVAALKNGSDENSIEQLLKDNATKIVGQADHDYLESLGKTSGVAALKAALDPRVEIAALKGNQTGGKDKPNDKPKDGKLTTEQVAICKSMGISHADFKAQLNTGES
jgi:phage I-like protein